MESPVRQFTTPAVYDADNYVRPLGARPLQRLVEFPVQVSGESYHRFEKVAKRAMRAWVAAKLNGLSLGQSDAEAYAYCVPCAEDSAARGLTKDEIALMVFTIRDYLVAQDEIAARVRRPGRMFPR